MSFDVSAVLGVINAALVAGGVIGGASLAAMWAVRAWRVLAEGSGETNFHWDQRGGESYEQFYERNTARDRERGL